MKIAIINYALPEADSHGRGVRWWHKSGSRWPASILNRKNDGTEYCPWPFLLAYLAPLLRADGHEVAFIDGCLRQWTLEELSSWTDHLRPDFVVFETSEQTEPSDRIIVTELSKYAPVVLIGPNVAEDRTDLLEWPGSYAAIPGEYLISVQEFFRNPSPRIGTRVEIDGTEQMDSLPFADRDQFGVERYNARFKTTPPGIQGQFVSMWGCQYRCQFCIWIHAYWSKTSQFRKQFSLPRLEGELIDLQANFPEITSLYDDADNHHYREADAAAYAEMMQRRAIPWAILTRADTYMTRDGEIDRDMWRWYRDHGCYAVKIGVEGDQEAMDATNKKLSESVVREWIPFMQDLGLTVYCSFMVGIPGTDTNSDRRSLELVRELAAYKPNQFEYFISYCDVTRVTPFFREEALTSRLHDGQLRIEELQLTGEVSSVGIDVQPNNL